MLEPLNFVVLGKKLEFTADEFQELKPIGKPYGIKYGYSIAISSDSSVVAISATRDNELSSGLVYIYRKQAGGSYVQTQVIAQQQPQLTYTVFGSLVRLSADGRTLIVTDNRTAINSKSVLEVYLVGGGTDFEHHQTLQITDEVDTYAGIDMSDDGYVITVSTTSNLVVTDAVSTVFVFTRSAAGQYVLNQRIFGTGAAANSYYGYSTALSSDKNTLVVGAPLDTGAVAAAGSVYVYTRGAGDVYTQVQKITLVSGSTYDFFGNAVAISDDGSRIVVCAVQVNNGSVPQGALFVYVRLENGQYIQANKLVADRGGVGYSEKLGFSVSANADCSRILTATEQEENDGNARVFLFTQQENGGYDNAIELKPSELQTHMQYGLSSAIASDGSFVIVGAPGVGARRVVNDEGSYGEVLQPGAVHVFN